MHEHERQPTTAEIADEINKFKWKLYNDKFEKNINLIKQNPDYKELIKRRSDFISHTLTPNKSHHMFKC